ncbi:MAG: reverse transcriptase domain-containing protein [Candidatus Paceibacterota bacterium]
MLPGNRGTTGSFNNRSTNTNFWASGASGWNRNLNYSNATVNRNTNSAANGFSVRCLKDCFILRAFNGRRFYSDMENSRRMEMACDLFRAYYDARKNKGRSFSALSFGMDYETKLFDLLDDIIGGRYAISPSICFVCSKPLKREIFAANFRDRIVHHFIYNYINPVFERLFINDAYSCRRGKGTSYGIRRLDHFIRSCSGNYKKDCYILKLDIRGYFMSINKHILYQKVEKALSRFRGKVRFDMSLVLSLIRHIIFHDSIKGCILKGKKEDWRGMPRSKSLFFTGKGRGLPIGNLTSQLFGNVYLNDFDHFVKHKLGYSYYGRYVDDVVIVHRSKEYLKSMIPAIREYLKKELLLDVHPQKTYLQHFSNGAGFLGVFIRPHRIYVGKRIKSSFYKKTNHWNRIALNSSFSEDDMGGFLSSENSYLGILKHYDTYRLRKKMVGQILSPYLRECFYFSEDYGKASKRR